MKLTEIYLKIQPELYQNLDGHNTSLDFGKDIITIEKKTREGVRLKIMEVVDGREVEEVIQSIKLKLKQCK